MTLGYPKKSNYKDNRFSFNLQVFCWTCGLNDNRKAASLDINRMVEAQDEDEDQKYPEEMIRAFALLKASKAQFQAHPERIEFEGSNCVT